MVGFTVMSSSANPAVVLVTAARCNSAVIRFLPTTSAAGGTTKPT